jgi:hypothetical protein
MPGSVLKQRIVDTATSKEGQSFIISDVTKVLKSTIEDQIELLNEQKEKVSEELVNITEIANEELAFIDEQIESLNEIGEP